MIDYTTGNRIDARGNVIGKTEHDIRTGKAIAAKQGKTVPVPKQAKQPAKKESAPLPTLERRVASVTQIVTKGLTKHELETCLELLNTMNETNHMVAFTKVSLGQRQSDFVEKLIKAGKLNEKIVAIGSTKELAPMLKQALPEDAVFTNNKGKEMKHGSYATSRAICFLDAYNKRHNVNAEGKFSKTNKDGIQKFVTAIIPQYQPELVGEAVAKYNYDIASVLEKLHKASKASTK